MATPAQIAANQLNSRKSTGPRTPEGRAKSSMNALRHGNRSRRLALLREESTAFEHRLQKWMATNDAQNDVEEYLTYRFQGHATPGPSASRGERRSARRHDFRGQPRPQTGRQYRV